MFTLVVLILRILESITVLGARLIFGVLVSVAVIIAVIFSGRVGFAVPFTTLCFRTAAEIDILVRFVPVVGFEFGLCMFSVLIKWKDVKNIAGAQNIYVVAMDCQHIAKLILKHQGMNAPKILF